MAPLKSSGPKEVSGVSTCYEFQNESTGAATSDDMLRLTSGVALVFLADVELRPHFLVQNAHNAKAVRMHPIEDDMPALLEPP